MKNVLLLTMALVIAPQARAWAPDPADPFAPPPGRVPASLAASFDALRASFDTGLRALLAGTASVTFAQLQEGLDSGIRAQFGDFVKIYSSFLLDVYARYDGFESLSRLDGSRVRLVTRWTIRAGGSNYPGKITDDIRVTPAGGSTIHLAHSVSLSFSGLFDWISNMFKGQVEERLAADFSTIDLKNYTKVPPGTVIESIEVLVGEIRATLR